MEGIDNNLALKVLNELGFETAEDYDHPSVIIDRLVAKDKLTVDAVREICAALKDRAE